MKAKSVKPDAHLEKLIAQVRAVTEAWGDKHDLLYDSGHKEPLRHYDIEPGELLHQIRERVAYARSVGCLDGGRAIDRRLACARLQSRMKVYGSTADLLSPCSPPPRSRSCQA